MVTIIDINNIPTAVVQRLEKNTPPIILYTIKPPPYTEYRQYELIQTGPPMIQTGPPMIHCIFNDIQESNQIDTQIENDIYTTYTYTTRCIVLLLLFFIVTIGFSIVLLSCSCF